MHKLMEVSQGRKNSENVAPADERMTGCGWLVLRVQSVLET